MEGLCNQLMAIFRTIGEALFNSTQNKSVCIVLSDVQSRNSIDLDVYPYFSPISIESFVDVNNLIPLLLNRNISVKLPQESSSEILKNIITCRRFPRRHMLPNENRDMGVFIAKSFPFAKKALKLSSCIIGLMSLYPRWKALQLRVEGDLMQFPSVRRLGLETVTKYQLQQAIDMISETPNLSAVYIASGIQDEKYNNAVDVLNGKFPHLLITRKKDILKEFPELTRELGSLCLEEQALVDWLVCLGAPYFAGPHASSFSYLVGYIRHYRGFGEAATNLYPEYQPYWHVWFPRV